MYCASAGQDVVNPNCDCPFCGPENAAKPLPEEPCYFDCEACCDAGRCLGPTTRKAKKKPPTPLNTHDNTNTMCDCAACNIKNGQRR